MNNLRRTLLAHTHTQTNLKDKKYFNLYNPLKMKSWFHKIRLKRNFTASLYRIRTNHYSLNESLYRFNLISSPVCNYSFPLQNFDHIFWFYFIYSSQRRSLILSLNKSKIFPFYDIACLLKNSKPKLLNCICNFLRDCKINIWCFLLLHQRSRERALNWSFKNFGWTVLWIRL